MACASPAGPCLLSQGLLHWVCVESMGQSKPLFEQGGGVENWATGTRCFGGDSAFPLCCPLPPLTWACRRERVSQEKKLAMKWMRGFAQESGSPCLQSPWEQRKRFPSSEWAGPIKRGPPYPLQPAYIHTHSTEPRDLPFTFRAGRKELEKCAGGDRRGKVSRNKGVRPALGGPVVLQGVLKVRRV